MTEVVDVLGFAIDGRSNDVRVRVPDNSDDPDYGVIAMIRAGERDAAITALMRRHGVAVYRYCREALRDPTLADDVHQQVFVQAHRDLARFHCRSSLRTWLFAIARHRVLDAAKSRRRRNAHLETGDVPETPDPMPAPGERLDDARMLRALAAAMATLSEPMRTALLLRYQHGFSFEDMAAICNERAGTLQARVARALPRLRALLTASTEDSTSSSSAAPACAADPAPAPLR